MSAHQNKHKRAARRIRDIHDDAHRAARRRRERAHAPPHSVAHHGRGIARKFAQIRGAGAGALAAFLAVLGPGLLAGLSDDDPAGITTYSILGTDHGYRLLWIIPASTVLLVYFHLMAVRIGAASGKGFVGIIRERWGRRWGPFRGLQLVAGQLWNDLRGIRGHFSSRFPGRNSIVDQHPARRRVDLTYGRTWIVSSG